MFKSLHEITIVSNFNKFLLQKSEYLKNLERRKNKSLRILNKTKIELIKQKIRKLNSIERNYKMFSKNDNNNIPIKKSSKLYLAPNIKQTFLTHEEAEYYERYKKKDFNIDTFSLIYKTTNSTEYPQREIYKSNVNESIKNNKKSNKKNNKNNKSTFGSFLTSVGKSVVLNNSRYDSSNFLFKSF